jgi:hypothetical protein
MEEKKRSKFTYFEVICAPLLMRALAPALIQICNLQKLNNLNSQTVDVYSFDLLSILCNHHEDYSRT